MSETTTVFMLQREDGSLEEIGTWSPRRPTGAAMEVVTSEETARRIACSLAKGRLPDDLPPVMQPEDYFALAPDAPPHVPAGTDTVRDPTADFVPAEGRRGLTLVPTPGDA